MNSIADRPRDASIQILVFLSGFTFLVHEVSWNRQLALVLGSTVMAATLVLAAFMAGFGAGAWFWGRRANERRRIGRLLALLLAGVGLGSAVSQVVIAGPVAGLADGPAHACALALLCGPAFLMGGVFPLAGKIALGAGTDPVRALGRLYAVETLGSVVGGLLAGYVLLGFLGQRGTVLTAVSMNVALALWLLVTRRFDDIAVLEVATAGAADRPRRAEARRDGGATARDPVAERRAALIGAFACGFAMLALQVIWLRALRIFLVNTSYTFALISSLVILGLFAGSALCARGAAGRRDPRRALVRALVLLGVVAGLGLVVLVKLPDLVMFPLEGILTAPLARITLLPLIASLLVVMPPAICSGYALPLACGMAAAGREGVSRDVGLVLMVNTTGAAVGPALAALVLLPWLGAVAAAVAVLALVAVAAAVVAGDGRPQGATARKGLAAVTVALALWVALAPRIRILPPSFSRTDRDVLFYLESVEGTVSVGRDRDTRARALHTYVDNAAVIGSTYDAVKAVKMVGHFPFFLGLEARDVLVIGFGIGVTTAAIAAHPEVQAIDCVELVPGLRDAAVFYRDFNRDVGADPRLRLIGGDGRHHLQTTRRTYDLISCDPTHPILGSGSLYTRDYFELCRERLNPGGMVSQYLPLHKLGTTEFLGLLRTFQAVFPGCTVWLGHYHAVLVGSREPIAPRFPDWRARVEALPEDPHFLLDAHHLAATLVLDGPTIGRLGAQSRLNTDDRSYTEFFAPGCLDDGNLSRNLRFLQDHRIDPATVFEDVGDAATFAGYVRGNVLLTESLLFQFAGDSRRSLEALRQAGEAAPGDQEFPFLIKLYF